MEYHRDLKKLIEQYNNELLQAYQKRQLRAEEDTTTASLSPPAEQAVATMEPRQEKAVATGGSAIDTGDEVAAALSDSVTYAVPDSMAGVPAIEEDVPVVAPFFAPGIPRHPVEFAELEQSAVYEDEAYIPTAGAPMQKEPQSNQVDQEEIGIGYAQIWVTTREAIPIPGAYVVVSSATREGEVLQYSAITNVDGLTPIFPLSAVAGRTTSQDYEDEDDMARPYTMYYVSVDAPGYYRVLHQDLPVYAGIKRVQPVEMTPEAERPVWKPPQTEPMSLE